MEFTPSVQNNKAIRFFMVCCVVMILCADIAAQTGLRSQDFRVNAERIMERIEALSEFGRNPITMPGRTSYL